MKYNLVFTVLFAFILSCSDNDDKLSVNAACGVDNPVEELAWLKSEIDNRNLRNTESMKYCYIVQGEYEDETVFVYEDCDPAVNKIVPVLNCEGVVLNTNGNSIGLGSIENKTIIWKGNNFVCNTDF